MEYKNLEDNVPKNFTGLGIKYEKTGGKFKGQWKQGKFWKGTYTFYEIKYISGERYQKEFIIPYKNGMGKSSRDKYEGEWCEGKKHGFGIMHWKDGETYRGNWVYGSIRGWGIMDYSNGMRYEGNWKNGKYCDQGTLKITENFIYSGLWKDGRPHGGGYVIYPNGDKYEGEWSVGHKLGYGKYTWKNGNSYEGKWQQDIPFATQLMKYDKWDNWVPENTNGILTYADGFNIMPCRRPGDTLEKNNNYIKFEKNVIVQDGVVNHALINFAYEYGLKIRYYGLFKITDEKGQIVDYMCHSKGGEPDEIRTKKYRLILEWKRLIWLFNELGKMRILPLGNKKDIQLMLMDLGWVVAP